MARWSRRPLRKAKDDPVSGGKKHAVLRLTAMLAHQKNRL
jgi:hypothetical protein